MICQKVCAASQFSLVLTAPGKVRKLAHSQELSNHIIREGEEREGGREEGERERDENGRKEGASRGVREGRRERDENGRKMERGVREGRRREK